MIQVSSEQGELFGALADLFLKIGVALAKGADAQRVRPKSDREKGKGGTHKKATAVLTPGGSVALVARASLKSCWPFSHQASNGFPSGQGDSGLIQG